MKKQFMTSLLIILVFAGLQSDSWNIENAGTIYAKAATKETCSLSKPTVKVARESTKKVKLSIRKVAGATKYKIYRATSKKGTYKYIGSTKNCIFKDKVKKNKSYYYKVKACNTVTGKTTTSKPIKATSTKNTSSNQEFADKVLKLVNQERAKAGLKALTTNTTLQNAANKRAKEIVSTFSHTRPDGTSFSTVLKEYTIRYQAAGENIAAGQKTPNEVMTGWMNSTGHRKNILGSQFGQVGIGVYKAADGKYYWTQVFTDQI